jgi:hypothetical protein
MLNEKFNLEKFGVSLDPIIAETKLRLATTLKVNPTLVPEEHFDVLASTYRINENLRKRIANYQPTIPQLKTFITKLQEATPEH